MTWQEQLWSELDGMTPVDRIKAIGNWIAEISQDLLPTLGDRRREEILLALVSEKMTVHQLADAVGARGATFARLAAEGRTARKRKATSNVAPTPPLE